MDRDIITTDHDAEFAAMSSDQLRAAVKEFLADYGIPKSQFLRRIGKSATTLDRWFKGVEVNKLLLKRIYDYLVEHNPQFKSGI